MRRSFWIVWVDPKSNAKNPYKRHTEERHNEEKSIRDGGGDWGSVAIAKNASSHWSAGGVGWTLPLWCPCRSTILTVDFRASSIVTEWISVCLFVAYLLCTICCSGLGNRCILLCNHHADSLDRRADWVPAAWRIIEPAQRRHRKRMFYGDLEKPSPIQESRVV